LIQGGVGIRATDLDLVAALAEEQCTHGLMAVQVITQNCHFEVGIALTVFA
jgi:hypothetical protein